MKYLLWTILIIIASCGSNYKQSIDTCIVRKGTFQIDVVENGELFATRNINISSPPMSWRFGMQKITKIVEDGTEVSQGDTVIIFDETEVQKAIIDAEAELEIAKAELKKKQAEQESKIYDLEAELKKADIAYQISKIEFEQAVFEAEVTRKTIQLNLEKSEISLDKAGEEIENQKKIHKEELYQSRLQIEQLQNRLDEAKETLNRLTVISPGNGIAVIRKNYSTGNKWQVGDQTWSGNRLINLPDLSELKVETETGMRIIAIRRNDCWNYNPQSDSSIQADDWLITRGTDEGYKELSKFLHGELEVLD